MYNIEEQNILKKINDEENIKEMNKDYEKH